ncbi:MAG TPA: hypothetical protein VM243_16900 [Phycisphaerae bacterium]|nr:hypothetical protein [Phycisphaerae bacterium]
MEFYLDDREMRPTGPAGTLGDVVEEARAQVAKDDRVIIAIRCDGADVANDDLAARLAEPVDRYDRVDLQSGRAEQLVSDALGQALQVLEDSGQLRAQVVEWLAQGETIQAKQGLVQCFQQWTQIHQAIAQSMAFLELDEKELIVEGRPLEAVLGDISGQLRQVKEVLEVGDDVLLADLLQYEFDAAIDKWRAAVQVVMARAQAALSN